MLLFIRFLTCYLKLNIAPEKLRPLVCINGLHSISQTNCAVLGKPLILCFIFFICKLIHPAKCFEVSSIR